MNTAICQVPYANLTLTGSQALHFADHYTKGKVWVQPYEIRHTSFVLSICPLNNLPSEKKILDFNIVAKSNIDIKINVPNSYQHVVNLLLKCQLPLTMGMKKILWMMLLVIIWLMVMVILTIHLKSRINFKSRLTCWLEGAGLTGKILLPDSPICKSKKSTWNSWSYSTISPAPLVKYILFCGPVRGSPLMTSYAEGGGGCKRLASI